MSIPQGNPRLLDTARAFIARSSGPGVKMARIAVEPRWAGLIDFETRLPSHVGGVRA